MPAILVAIWVILRVSSLAADQGGVTPQDEGCAQSQEPFDPEFAQFLSVSSTFGGMALGGVFFFATGAAPNNAVTGLVVTGSAITGLAMLVGPGVGHFYVGNYAWPIGRMAMRLAVGGLGALGFFGWMANAFCSDECGEPNHWAVPLWVAASVGYVALMAIDLATVKRDARRANQKARQSTVSLVLVPTTFSTPGASGGLSLAGRF